jgi:hypothetical protein
MPAYSLVDDACGVLNTRPGDAMTTPEIKTETVSEVVFMNSQLIELIRTHYGAETVPLNAEVKGHFPHGSPLEGIRFVWKSPDNVKP